MVCSSPRRKRAGGAFCEFVRYKDRVFNIGSGELILIAVAALLILGPKRLPELARGLGKFLREFRRQTDQVRNVVEREFYRMDEPEHPPAILPAPNTQAAHTSPGGDDDHNPDGTLKNHPPVPPVATAPAVAPANPVNPVAPAPAAPAAAPAAEVKPPVDHAPPIEDVKSQVSSGLDHSDPSHPDYYKDEGAPSAPVPATEKPTG